MTIDDSRSEKPSESDNDSIIPCGNRFQPSESDNDSIIPCGRYMRLKIIAEHIVYTKMWTQIFFKVYTPTYGAPGTEKQCAAVSTHRLLMSEPPQ